MKTDMHDEKRSAEHICAVGVMAIGQPYEEIYGFRTKSDQEENTGGRAATGDGEGRSL